MSNEEMDIFPPKSKEQIKIDKTKVDEIISKINKEWIRNFKKRKDIKKNKDKSYNVSGDILSLSPKPLKEFPVKLAKVKGNIICFDLESLDNFPKEVNGNIILINCKLSHKKVEAHCKGTYKLFIGKAKSFRL